MVIANHVLFYLQDVDKGLAEIRRVMAPNGVLYCTTYSKIHMREVTELCTGFDPQITLSPVELCSRFGMENGEKLLNKYFRDVEMKVYNDQLVIDKGEDLVDYILSCHGNQSELIIPRIQEFREYIDQQIKKNGSILIHKQACLFIGRK